MNTTRIPALAAFLAASVLANSLLIAADAPAKPEEAPLVESLKDLKNLNRRIVAMAKPSVAATVSLMAKGGGGAGSGVIVSEDGVILTAAHVIAAMGDEIVVIFSDGTRRTAKALGADFDRDAAMAKITEDGRYPHVALGDSNALVRNDWCIALGHPGGFDPTRTPPVRLGRILRKGQFLITDSAVVGGDSGGPLFDADGRLIGIHSNIGATLMENRHVPVSVYKKSWEDMKKGKRTGTRFNKNATRTNPNRPVLGVQLGEPDEGGGVLIEGVMDNSPASRAGLEKGDVITAVNSKEVTDREELIKTVGKFKPGKKISVSYRRNEEVKKVDIKLARLGDLAKRREQGKEPEPKESAEEKTKGAEENDDDGGDALDRFLDKQFDPEKGEVRLELTPEDLERFGGMDKIMERVKQRARAMGGNFQKEQPAPDKEKQKEEVPPEKPEPEISSEKEDSEKSAGTLDKEELKKRLMDAMKSGQLELTPQQLEQFGGMASLQELLREMASEIDPESRVQFAAEADPFYAASAKAITPVTRKAGTSTVAVHLDGEPVALGTVVSRENWIVTKNSETLEGEVTVEVDGTQVPAKLLKRFPKRDLTLFQVDAAGLQPIRWRQGRKTIPVGSLLTSSSANGEPLGFGLLSVKSRALGGIGFLGISAGEAEQGVRINSLVKGSAAEKAELQVGDVITAVNGKACNAPIEFGNRIRGLKAGEAIDLSILRGEEKLDVEVTLGERQTGNATPRFKRMNKMSGPLSERTGGFPSAIQHDIPLRPSECGGPLLDLTGRCLGINVSRAGRVRTFAIPADDLKKLLAEVNVEAPAPAETNPGLTEEECAEILKSLAELQKSIKEIEERIKQAQEK